MKKSQTPRKITRAALYALVWKTPMHTLAPEFGISDVGLAKQLAGALLDAIEAHPKPKETISII
jgi:hypothetical protein